MKRAQSSAAMAQIMSRVCEYPRSECAHRCGSAEVSVLVRKDTQREVADVALDDADGYTYGAYHWADEIVPVCSIEDICPVWASIIRERIGGKFYANELYIYGKVEEIVFSADLKTPKGQFELREWFKLLRDKAAGCGDYTEQQLENYKQELKRRYERWTEDRKRLGLPI